MHFCLSDAGAVIHLLSVSAHLEMHWPLAALLDVQADSQDVNSEMHLSGLVPDVVKHLVSELTHLERHWLLPLVLPPVLLPVLLPGLPLGVQADSQDFKSEMHVAGLAPGVARHSVLELAHLERHWLLPVVLLPVLLDVQADSQDFKSKMHVSGLAPGLARHLLSDSAHLEMHWLLLPVLLLAKVGKARAKLRTLAMYVNFMLSVMA